MLKGNEGLEIMGEAIYWQFRYFDVMEEIANETSVNPKPLVSCTEVFLLDVTNWIIAFSTKPRKVLRQLPWLRRMYSAYPKVLKAFRVLSSPEMRRPVSEFRVDVPSVMRVVYQLQYPEDPEKQGKNCQELLKLISEFFQILGVTISIEGLGNDSRDEEFLEIAGTIRSMGGRFL